VSCEGRGEKTFNLSGNEKSRVPKLSNSEHKHFTDTKTKIMTMTMLMTRNEIRDYKNMATADGVYNTTSTMQNDYYTKQLTQNFKTA